MAIGQRVPMIDAAERVTGRVPYALNVELPGMLVGRVLRSPHAHARLLRVDVSKAARLPGVFAVVSRDDVQDRDRFDPYYGALVRDQPVLALKKVRYEGEAVAAVAAIDEETAEEALDLIEVEYEPLPAVFEPEEALAPGAPLLFEEDVEGQPTPVGSAEGVQAPTGNIADRYEVRWGDVEQGFREADFVFEDEYRCPSVQHAALEPHVSVAQFDGDRLTVWSSTQTPHPVRAQLADIFKMPMTRVRVVVPTLGGGYGSKAYPKLEPIAALLAWKSRRPVRVALSRAEVFVTTYRSAASFRIKTGVMRDGTVVARQVKCYFNKGAYLETGPRVLRGGALATCAPYRIPNVHIEGYVVFTNLPPSGPFRAPGAAQGVWAAESHMDAVARRLGMDPVEFRRKNLVRNGDRYVGGGLLEDLHLEELLDDAARAIGWGGPSQVQGDTTVRRGKAIAVSLKTTRTPSTSSASCKLNEDGSLSVLTSSVEMGQGAKTALAQIAADAVGVPYSQVSISEPDTDVTPYDQTTSSSRTTYCMGQAVRLAGKQVRDQLLDLAAEALEVAPEDVVLAEGRASVKGAPGRSIPYGELVRRGRLGNLLGQGTFINRAKPDPATGRPGASTHWHHAVAAAEVEVDMETGKVCVVRFHAGVFAGRMINPTQCELQTEGSVVFGLGQALMEEMVFENGHMANPNLSDYMLPSFKDLPARFTVNVMEEPGSEDIHGIGETALPPVLAAIGNAVADAIGTTVRELPLLPERVLHYIQEGEETS